MDSYQKNLAEFEDFLMPSKPLDQDIASYLETIKTDSRFADWQAKQATRNPTALQFIIP